MNGHLASRTACILAALMPVGQAQAPPGAVPPSHCDEVSAAPRDGSPAAARWQLGRDALAAGDAAGALPHLLAALEFHPCSPPVLLDLVRACEPPGPRALWLSRYVAAVADDRGRVPLPPPVRKELAADDLGPWRELATLRAQAAQELARSVGRLKGSGRTSLGNGVVARWAAELFLELSRGAPALLPVHGPTFEKAVEGQTVDYDAVCRALLSVAQGRVRGSAAPADAVAGDDAASLERAALQLEAARLLRGLVRQSGYGKDVKGPKPPDLSGLEEPAAAAERAAADACGEPRVYTIAELEALDPAAREEFSLRHASWADPAVAMSATGKYRIETVCGHETLLGAATTIELHHERLAQHFGSDPFAGRPGLVRLVPEVSGLETEGAPHWWAQGFQGGDRTVIRFSWGRISELGRILTHELTHRFDGALRPFGAAWYMEGHADWTGEHYVDDTDRDFVVDHLKVHTCATTYYEGYGDGDNLKKLLRNDLEDYRHNYFAGYSLYAFLTNWPPQQPPRYKAAFERYLQNARAGQRDPVGWFTKTVCDGEDGRAAGFDAFVSEWRGFLKGCYDYLDERTRGPDNAWVAAYGRRGAGSTSKLVLDVPTRSWARTRAEPFFGQGHAGRAGSVLARAGMQEEAAAAWLWSLQCEGWHRGRALRAAAALQAVGKEDAAATLRLLCAQRFGAGGEQLPEPPLVGRLSRLCAYLDALETTAAGFDAGGAAPDASVVATALRAERQRLGALVGRPLPAVADATPPPPVPRALGLYGWVEDSLTDYDDHRVEGLWYTTPSGDLHVGRERPSAGTGLERRAHQRNAYTRSAEWLRPGEYTVRMQVHFTTSFVSGAVVLGHWRRDRGIRLSFTAGDQDYASGRSDDVTECDRVVLSLDGLWERDPHMPLSHQFDTVEFDRPKPSFEIVLHVRGPSVAVEVEGEERFRYTTHDGSPIEGHLGFASRNGAYRVQTPTVQRLDLALPGQALAGAAAIGLDTERQPAVPVDGLVGLRTRGLPVGENGALVLWLPPGDDGDDVGHKLPRALPVLAKFLSDRVEFPQPWLLAVPADTSKMRLAEIQDLLAEHRNEPMPVVEHHVGPPLRGNPWVLFVDAAGVLRGASQVGDPRLFSVVQRWARLLRAP